jgi:hypothetical protein
MSVYLRIQEYLSFDTNFVFISGELVLNHGVQIHELNMMCRVSMPNNGHMYGGFSLLGEMQRTVLN